MRSKKDEIRAIARRENDARYYQKHKLRLRQNQAEYYSKTSAERIAVVKEYTQTPQGRARQLVKAARSRSKLKGLDFSISYDDIFPIVENGVCQVTGIPFTFESYSPFCSTIDRTDNAKGYTLDNIKVVIKAYNGAKGCGTHEDVLKMVQALVAK